MKGKAAPVPKRCCGGCGRRGECPTPLRAPAPRRAPLTPRSAPQGRSAELRLLGGERR